jgi:CheY-like chemotaxis protein
MRILVLDDRAGQSEALASTLRENGFAAMAFTSPQEALEHLQEADVLVSNHQVGEMTGLEIARQAYAQGWRGSFFLTSGNLMGQLQKLGTAS